LLEPDLQPAGVVVGLVLALRQPGPMIRRHAQQAGFPQAELAASPSSSPGQKSGSNGSAGLPAVA
ncbi:MAG: hypothetical protein ABIO37_09260, partial [Caulobacteraceae bacterium]